MSLRVLLAVDFSDCSNGAAEYLKGMRFHRPVDLEVISVLPPIPVVDSTGLTMPVVEVPYYQEDIAELEKMVQEVAAQFEGTFNSVTSTVKLGVVSSEIVKRAHETKADLIVLGATGHPGITGVLLGSVAEQVAHDAKSSTLVVRPNQKSAPNDYVSRVLVALENSPSDTKLLAHTHALQIDSSAEVQLAHVMPVLSFFRQDLRKRRPKEWADSRTAAENHVGSISDSVRHQGYKVHGDVLEAKHIGAAIVEHADNLHCDLIVTGERGQHGALDLLGLGSTSRFVLRHAEQSVLVVKESQNDA